jgi:putative tryptophan/tyrosine transport system permease protein
MSSIFYAIVTQVITFMPLALGISISYRLLRATDMTLDGSFVLGAAVFAHLVTLGVAPTLAGICALFAGSCAGVMVSLIQQGGRVDPLLAGVLATFILTSGNLLIMGRPNINLLSQHTLVSNAFASSDSYGWMVTGLYALIFCLLSCLLIRTRFGLMLRALGDNPTLLKKLGHRVELYRCAGFAFTNTLAAGAGMLTAQTVGYADVSMGFGMTLTGIGAIILGQQMLRAIKPVPYLRTLLEFGACIIGVISYFFAVNVLLRFDIDPVYLKMLLGLVLILFLRSALRPTHAELSS